MIIAVIRMMYILHLEGITEFLNLKIYFSMNSKQQNVDKLTETGVIT